MKYSPKYVFLITIDCLRADKIGCIGKGHLTPNIDDLGEEGLVFRRAFANGPATAQSFTSIFTSTPFLLHSGLKLKSGFETLAEILEKEGFWTAAFHSNPFLSSIFGWNRGFREYYDLLEDIETPTLSLIRSDWKAKAFRLLIQNTGLESNTTLLSFLRKTFYRLFGFKIPYVEGKELNRYVFSWISKNKNKRFFLWIHYMDPHEPFIPPDKYIQEKDIRTKKDALLFNIRSGLNPTIEQNSVLSKLYESEVAYVDECVGSLLFFLDQHKLIDDALIVLCGDHGQGFLEHGYFAHPPHSLYNELIHVPLIISNAGVENEETVTENVQLLDLSPTILDILRIDPPTSFLGTSLLSLKREALRERKIFIESAKFNLNNLRFDLRKKIVACIYRNSKLIINDVMNTVEMYDLQRDFKEENNIADVQYKTCNELKGLVTEHIRSIEQTNVKFYLQ